MAMNVKELIEKLDRMNIELIDYFDSDLTSLTRAAVWQDWPFEELLFKAAALIGGRDVEKAGFDPGTRRRRADGTYEKQQDGSWIRVKEPHATAGEDFEDTSRDEGFNRDEAAAELFESAGEMLPSWDLENFAVFLDSAPDADIQAYQLGERDPLTEFFGKKEDIPKLTDEDFTDSGAYSDEGTDRGWSDSEVDVEIDWIVESDTGYVESEALAIIEHAKSKGMGPGSLQDMSSGEFLDFAQEAIEGVASEGSSSEFLDVQPPTPEEEAEYMQEEPEEPAGSAADSTSIAAINYILDEWAGAKEEDARNAIEGLGEEELQRLIEGDFDVLDETFVNRMDAESEEKYDNDEENEDRLL